jgi:predicted GIY-YIG superfamily endonuclease
MEQSGRHLYIDITSDLDLRVWQHKASALDGFLTFRRTRASALRFSFGSVFY